MTEQEEIEKATTEICKRVILYFGEVAKKNVPPSWHEKIGTQENADRDAINFTMTVLMKISLEIMEAFEEHYKLGNDDIEAILNNMVFAILSQLK